MSENRIELMEKKNQSNYRQTNLPLCKEPSANKFLNNNDWKRENNNGRYQGNDSNKKFNQPKTNVFDDRRPRQRGYLGKHQKEMKNFLPVASDLEESCAVVADHVDRRGKRTGNLNHMVNFYYQEDRSVRYNGAKHGYKKYFKDSNKERFLQANCQFVVKQGGDYRCHDIDPDLLINWDLVLQVRLFVNELPSCPICLYPPRASKITKCGHVYCWPCMLHYLSLSSESGSWSKCPICCEPVYNDDLKSACIREVTKYQPGMPMTLKLMCKSKVDGVVSPSTPGPKEENKKKAMPSIRDCQNSTHSKLSTADDEHLIELMENEKSELMEMMLEEEHCSLQSTFITLALERLENEMTSLAKTSLPESISNPSLYPPSTSYSSAFDDLILPNEIVSPTELEDEQLSPDVEPDDKIVDPSVPNADASSGWCEKLKYFYQAADGQNIYLHSLNVRCLVAEYSSLELCPTEIQAMVVDIEDFSMSEDIRHHFPYLSHLPTSCQFRIVELDLRPPLVGEASLKISENLIKRRKKEREVKDRRDKMNAAKIQKMENKMIGYDPDSKIIASDYHRLLGDEVVREELTGSHHFPEIGKAEEPGPSSEVSNDGNNKKNADSCGAGPSFAQMLRVGKKAEPISKPQISIGQWNAGMKGSNNVIGRRKGSNEGDGVEVPNFSESWNFDLTKKLEETGLSKKQGDGKNSHGGKKKNKKGILLFATGGAGPRCK